MLVILLKSSACLAIFMLFYKLCLEKTSAHTFKRFYLIGAVLISICIPFITFIEYIEVQPEIFTNSLVLDNNEKFQTVESTSLKDYIPIILWSIYILGASIFSFRFLKNLNNLFQKIKRNPKFKNENTFHVLLQELITPHTFLNYIFLNKTKYENNQIPHEVLLHEQTHANQKHALDIIFIEILQIVFWFNPLLYFIKNDIKLNHEFLADQAVINKGVNTKDYQQLLLAFSSNVSHSSLANAINYSLIRTERSRSIKKRFTIMKTKTSKPTLWLRSLIILPLLAILIYGFSDKKTITKEKSVYKKDETPQILLPQEKDKRSSLSDVDKELEAFNNLKINYPENQQKATPEQIAEYNKLVKKFNSLPEGSRIIKVKDKDRIEYIYGLMTLEQKNTNEIFPNFSTISPIPKPYQQKATPKQLAEYNNIIKKINIQPENKRIIKQKDVIRLEYIYSLMTKEQKENAEPFPKLVPPPPAIDTIYISTYNSLAKRIQTISKNKKANIIYLKEIYSKMSPSKKSKVISPDIILKSVNEASKEPEEPIEIIEIEVPITKESSNKIIRELENGEVIEIVEVQPPQKTGYIDINGEKHYYATNNGVTKYYNRWGAEVDKQGNKLSNKQTDGSKVLNNQNISKVYKDDEIISEFKKAWKNNESTENFEPDVIVEINDKIENKNSDKDNFSTETTNLTINADTLEELKDFDWDALTEIFANNNPETIIELTFNYKKRVLLGNSEIDSFNLNLSDKTSELKNLIKKSKKIISKLKTL